MAAYVYSYDKEKEVARTKLQTNRNMWKLMILSVLTLGIYTIIFFIPFSFDLDKVAPKRDRSKTINFVFVYLLALVTFALVLDVWHYQVAARIEEGLAKRKIDYHFSRTDFWLWLIVGSFFLVGPFVYYHKLCKAMNLLCADYNERPIIEED